MNFISLNIHWRKALPGFILLVFLSAGSFAQSCLPEGIHLSRQGQIDSFPINYPGCTQVEGLLLINGIQQESITNLDSLIYITSVGGPLEIYGNSQLIDLAGLLSLTTIGGNLILENNLQLTSLYGLNSVQSINGHLDIDYHPALLSLSALSALQSINGTLHIGNMSSLVSLVGLENIDYTTITNLEIGDCPLLSKCDVSSICSFLTFQPNSHEIYSNAVGCTHASEIESFCAGCPSDGMTFLTQGQIDSFPFNFPGCNQIIGDVIIDDLTSGNIKNLDSLFNLQYVSGELTIQGNDSLNDLVGLVNLFQIQGELNVSNNVSLTSLEGLGNIFREYISNLIIQNCPNLSICNVSSVCSYLQLIDGPATISGNAPGCESKGQVLTYCLDQDVDGIIDSLDNCVFVYNPFQENADNDNAGDACDYGSENNFGVGTDNPVTKLHVAGGLAFIDNNNGSLLMKSPDNSCWVLSVSNAGALTATKVPCPE